MFRFLLAIATFWLSEQHGIMQMPLPWQLGNVHEDLGQNSCASGGCNWFTNFTTIPKGQAPTIPQNSPLRTFSDLPPLFEDWTARNPWRAPGTAKVYSPCGADGGNPEGCVQNDGTMGPCTTDDGGFGYGIDGRSLGGNGVVTSWQSGSVVEVGWSVRSNHGGGYSYRLCKKPSSGNFSKVTEECFTKTVLAFVGNTSFIQYNNGQGRFEIDALRTTTGTYPAGSMWTKNPIPSFGKGPNVMANGTQFPLPTLNGKHVQTPSPLAGFCPCRKQGGVAKGDGRDRHSPSSFEEWVHTATNEALPPGQQSCYCCCSCCDHGQGDPDFDNWLLVDRLRLPANLDTGSWVLGFRWDCEQSLQVWQQCASINVVSAASPPPAPKLAPLCGDEAHACCMNKSSSGKCTVWSGVSSCVISKAHCENGTGPRRHKENGFLGCHGEWTPQVPPSERCVNSKSSHTCGFGCTNAKDLSDLSGAVSTSQRTCSSYAALGNCTAGKAVCEGGSCRGAWTPV
jgi:hypothetical protein